ncbi:MAG: class I SAM-dependent methyltransferase [Pyrodictiaceae archaeon]
MSAIRVPYVPTPLSVARKMLEIAGVGTGDIIYDLGCGDGRIVLLAVREFGARKGVCVELREDLLEKAKREATRYNVLDRVELRHEDFFETNISDATVVTLYLLTSINDELAPKLERELDDGARIVSHEFKITSWKPLIAASVYDGLISHSIYLYVKGMHK